MVRHKKQHLFHMSHLSSLHTNGLHITELLFREIIEFVLIQCRNQVHCKRNERKLPLCVCVGVFWDWFRLRTQSTGNFLINSTQLSMIIGHTERKPFVFFNQ